MSLENDFYFLIIKDRFPRIALGIEVRWGTSDLEPYILNLLYDTRENSRQGFPKDVFDSLQSLLLYHHRQFPGKRSNSPDIWDSAFSDLQ